ncbi:right-handed parallel beta-helix repeat-containing protein [Luteolibacter sp. LG18]|uniref:right-handed parallel beta-helix repeat-containing protein n=1 Tax=Luteolibacter sp. LG18 TaxID=2819286 RepID=UPI002B299017|nr:hypothetical protein llg_44410 [Luteolibacter sp. LG18]
MKPSLSLALFITLASQASARTYHFDDTSGDDAKDGLTPATAWRSLEKFNATRFTPGDEILFKAGGKWLGQMKPSGSGTNDSKRVPIILGRYGKGAAPEIAGEGKVLDTLLVEDVEHWDITGLAITNQGAQTAPGRTGIRMLAKKLPVMHGIVLRGLWVHDVNGDLRKSHEGTGILFEADAATGASYDGILIEQCKVERTDRNGICQRATGRARSRNVIIRGNTLDDIGGDGIKLWGTNGGLIERNIVRKCRARAQDMAAGIWPFACDDTVIQFNEVSGTKGTADGQAFDSDYICNRTIIQYNYSYENEGGFMLVCSPSRSFNRDTVIRYNVSVHDGVNSGRVIQIGGNPSNTRFHNNTIILGANQNLPMVSFNEWDGGKASGTRFDNNLFIVAEGGRATYRLDSSTGTAFTNNLFLGKHEGFPATASPPVFTGPIVPSEGVAFFRSLNATSRSKFPKGISTPNSPGKDLFGSVMGDP